MAKNFPNVGESLGGKDIQIHETQRSQIVWTQKLPQDTL